MSAPASTTALSLSPKSSNIAATKIFIDLIPEYRQLQSCAEPQVSTIVRAMVSGCGDGGRMTSYTCFCYSSSTKFDYLISAQVASACSDQAQATSAQDVFAKYCQKGVTMGTTPAATSKQSASSTSTSSIESDLSTSSSSIMSQMPSVSTTTSSSSPSSMSPPTRLNSRTTTIAVAVCIPLVVVALITAGFLAYRRRKQDSNTGHPVQLADDKCAELIEESPFEKVHHSVAELPSQESFVELPVFPEASNKPRGYESGSIAEMYVAPHSTRGNIS